MRILIVTEIIAGNGHYKAAVNLKKAFLSHNFQHDIEIITIISLLSKRIERLITYVYLTLITKQPKLWGWIYRRETKFSFVFRKLIAMLLVYGLRSYVRRHKPEVVIATHASGIGALALLKKQQSFKLGAAFTDFNVNSFWVHPAIDYYFVGHESLKEQLIYKYQVPEEKVYVTGIPIDPLFASKGAKIKQQRKRNPFSILIMGGGLGLGGIQEIVETLSNVKIGVPFSLKVITGTNQKLYDQLHKIKHQFSFPVEVYHYVEDVQSLMANSQLIITKAGGLTTSEAMSIPLPILLYRPLPGQEEKNTRFLIKNHAAILTNTPEMISYWVKYLYDHPRLYDKLKAHGKKIGKPNASLTIAQVIEKEAKLHYLQTDYMEKANQGF